MLPELSEQWEKLESGRRGMLSVIDALTPDQLQFRSAPDRWTVLQALQHVVLGEAGMRRTEADLRNHPLRETMQPGEMVQIVKDILEKDVPVDVPDPAMEPDGRTTVDELRGLWKKERRAMAALLETVTAENSGRVMFSHVAAGPLTPRQMLEIAVLHLDTHRRQIDRIRTEMGA